MCRLPFLFFPLALLSLLPFLDCCTRNLHERGVRNQIISFNNSCIHTSPGAPFPQLLQHRAVYHEHIGTTPLTTVEFLHLLHCYIHFCACLWEYHKLSGMSQRHSQRRRIVRHESGNAGTVTIYCFCVASIHNLLS